MTVRSRGGDLIASDGGLKYRGPVHALDDALRQAIAAHRPELLAMLTWDADTVAKEVNAAHATIEAALPTLSESRQNVLRAMRTVVEQFESDRDPLLFGAADWINGHVARWASEK